MTSAPVRHVVRGCALLFCSGLCALVYQTVWMREFRAIFGASTAATSAVLGIFMGGLGVGALLLGKRIESHRRPLETYGNLEVGIGVFAGVSPFLIDGARHAYLALGGSVALGVAALPVRLLVATLVLIVPAALMGGTLPAMARSITAANDASRRALALVYGLNTLGAVAGVALTSFLLFEIFGLRTTLWLTAGGNVLLGLVARALARTEDVEPSTTTTTQRPDPAVAAAAFVAGFAFLMYELVWYRLFSPILGGSTYCFSAILAVALLGIGTGGAVYAARERRPSWAAFGATSVLEAFFLLGPLALGDRVPFFVFYLREWAQTSFSLLVFSWFVLLMLMVFPAALISGYQFPLLIALRGAGRGGVAVDSGAIYSANTVGSIVGSVVGGFFLLPLLGAFPAARVAALLLLAAGALALLRDKRVAFAVVGVVVVGAVATADGPGGVWRGTAVGAGRGGLTSPTAADRDRIVRRYRAATVERRDGVESGISVLDGDGYALAVNGKSDGNVISDAQTVVGATLLPTLLLRQTPKTGFVIGLGTGQSAGWLAAVPSMERVDVAEIEPAVLDFAARCAVTNKDVMTNPRVNHLVGDGRELLQVSKGGYDVIMSEPSNPYRAGLAGFYSTDFYAQAVEKLNPQGVFAQWIQGYEVEPSTVQMAIATMKQHFHSVSVWSLGYGDILLMGSPQPQVIDVDVAAARLQTEPFREAFQRVYLYERIDEVLAQHVGNDVMTTALADAWEGGFNSDDLPLLEFAFARSVGRRGNVRPIAALADIARGLGAERPATTTPRDWSAVDAARARRGVVVGASDFGALAAHLDGDALAARVHNVVGDVLRDAPAEQVEPALAELQKTLPTEAAALRLIRATRSGADDDAAFALDEFVGRVRVDPWLVPVLTPALSTAMANAAHAQGERAARLLREPFAAGRLGDPRRRALLAAWDGKSEAGCVADFDVDRVPANAVDVAAAVACFAAFDAGRVDAARALLDEVRASDARPFVWNGPPEGAAGAAVAP